MTNGTCPVGSANAAMIAALTKEVETACSGMGVVEERMNTRVSKVEAKQDWMIYLLIVNLVAVIVGYIT